MLTMVNVANLSHSGGCVAVPCVALIYIFLMNDDIISFHIFKCLSSLVNCSNSCHFKTWVVYLFTKKFSKIFFHSTYQSFVRNIFFKYFLPAFWLHFLYLKWAIWTGNSSHSDEVQCIGFSPFPAQDLCLTKYFPNQNDLSPVFLPEAWWL